MNINKFEQLVGKELNLIELSNELEALGCEDICNFGNLEDLLDDGNMVVATDNNGDEHIQIYYEVICKANIEEEAISASIVKIGNIEEF